VPSRAASAARHRSGVRTDAGEGRSVSSLGGRAGCSVSYLVLNVLSRREHVGACEGARERARAMRSCRDVTTERRGSWRRRAGRVEVCHFEFESLASTSYTTSQRPLEHIITIPSSHHEPRRSTTSTDLLV
jgi:hypothetical protein